MSRGGQFDDLMLSPVNANLLRSREVWLWPRDGGLAEEINSCLVQLRQHLPSWELKKEAITEPKSSRKGSDIYWEALSCCSQCYSQDPDWQVLLPAAIGTINYLEYSSLEEGLYTNPELKSQRVIKA